MKLLTTELRRQLPHLYATENDPDPMVVCKFFTPDSSWTWYVLEFDGQDTFFGFVVGHFPELGYFSLSELESVQGPYGLAIERHLWWTPVPISQVKQGDVR